MPSLSNDQEVGVFDEDLGFEVQNEVADFSNGCMWMQWERWVSLIIVILVIIILRSIWKNGVVETANKVAKKETYTDFVGK